MLEPNQNPLQNDNQGESRPVKKVYQVVICLSLLIALGHAYYKEIFEQTSLKEVMNIISDSFVLVAAVVGGVGALMCIASYGQFDSLGYAGRWVLDRFTLRDLRKLPPRESFYDYKMKKEEKRKTHANPLLWVGLGALGLGIVFLFIYSLL